MSLFFYHLVTKFYFTLDWEGAIFRLTGNRYELVERDNNKILNDRKK
ncbi:hypothetical protein Xenpb_02626 [Xenorhabdus sp. PB62.4]|nr:hypothetical protein [Xenorhabdus sp. PB62.4]